MVVKIQLGDTVVILDEIEQMEVEYIGVALMLSPVEGE